tara:strand:+ start:304 stop:489 length:186 start_codon:yes stop_codon:yes gene_type:complete
MTNVLVADIKFYKVDEDGTELLTKDGKNIQLFELKRGIRFKPLEYLCEDLDETILEEIENG